MKKKIYVYYFIYLILALITCNTIFSIFNFNYYSILDLGIDHIYSSNYYSLWDHVDYLMANFLLTGIISFLFNYLAKSKIEKIIKKQNEKVLSKNDTQERQQDIKNGINIENVSKIKKYFILINFIAYFIFNATYFICNWKHFLNLDVFSYMPGIEIVTPFVLIITSLVQNLLILIPTNILILNFFKEKKEKKPKEQSEKSKNIKKIITYILCFCVFVCIILNIYNNGFNDLDSILINLMLILDIILILDTYRIKEKRFALIFYIFYALLLFSHTEVIDIINLPEIINFILIILLCITYILNMRKYKSVYLKRVCKFSIYSIVAILMFFNIYNYIDISEFEYMYEFEPINDKFEFVVVGNYQDVRRWLSEEDFVVPSKLWGQEVKYVENLTNKTAKKLILPNTVKFYYVKNCFYYNYNQYNFEEILMTGEPLEWYVEDSIIYNIDKTEMFFPFYNKDYLYISESIRNFIIPNKDNIITEVSEKNPYFYEYENTIWNTKEYCEKFDTINVGYSFGNQEGANVILPKELTGEFVVTKNMTLYETIDKITILKDFKNEIIPLNIVKEYIVEEGNEYYSTYDGNLYNKDMTKLIALRKYDYSDTIKLPNTLEEFGNIYVLNSLCDAVYSNSKRLNIAIDIVKEDINGLIYHNNTLYHNQREKILINFDGDYKITENTKEIDEILLNALDNGIYEATSDINIELDENNQFFSLFDNALYNNAKTKLLSIYKKTGSNNDATNNIILPKELESINESELAKLKSRNIILEEGNIHLELYEGNLYTKGRENLIIMNNNQEVIKLPKELKGLSEENRKDIMFKNIELGESEYFTLYKNNLYTKDKKKILAIGAPIDTVVLSKELQEIDDILLKNCYSVYDLESILGKSNLEIEEGNEYFSIESNLLYNKEKTKLILIGNYADSKILLNENVQHIDVNIIKRGYEHNFSESKYITEVRNNHIIYKDGYEHLEEI